LLSIAHILITGVNGYLSRHLAHALVNKGAKVEQVVHFMATSVNKEGVNIATGDWRSLNLNLLLLVSQKTFCGKFRTVSHLTPMTLTLWSKEQIEEILPALRKIYH